MEGYVLVDNCRMTEKEGKRNGGQAPFGYTLDSGDRHYDQKYQDMSDRLDNLYDRISELDEEIAGVDARIQAAYEKQITGKMCINSFWILIHYMRG